jgi:hypothetical protein
MTAQRAFLPFLRGLLWLAGVVAVYVDDPYFASLRDHLPMLILVFLSLA